jgi:hypothetical protein
MKDINMNDTYYIKNWTLKEFPITSNLNAELADADDGKKYLGISSESDTKFETYISKDKLRSFAVFILNYLENNH